MKSEESHRWGLEGGTPLMGTQGGNPIDGNSTLKMEFQRRSPTDENSREEPHGNQHMGLRGRNPIDGNSNEEPH